MVWASASTPPIGLRRPTGRQEPRTSSGNGSSPSPAISIHIPMEQRKSTSSSGPLRKCGSHSETTPELYWEGKWNGISAQNRSSNGVICLRNLYLQFTHAIFSHGFALCVCVLGLCIIVLLKLGLVLSFYAFHHFPSPLCWDFGHSRWRELSGWSTTGVQGHFGATVGHVLKKRLPIPVFFPGKWEVSKMGCSYSLVV